MTWEEAIAILQEKYDYCKSFYDLAARPKEDYAETAQYLQALQVALSALRPVSRERMRGEWIAVGAITCKCSRCQHSELSTRANEYLFCPRCGAPMTDEAVEMVMERLEALKDES